MNIENIILRRKELDKQLYIALATMEKKDTIKQIRFEILENQANCPHFDSNYNWTIEEGYCPYCGKKIG